MKNYPNTPNITPTTGSQLTPEQDIPSDVSAHLDDQQNLREEIYEGLFKSLILTEHAIHSCEQALKHTATEYSDTYRALMQQRIATYTKHMALLKQMMADS